MAFKQIAFDFGELPQKPKPENILTAEAQALPVIESLPPAAELTKAEQQPDKLEALLAIELLPEVAELTEGAQPADVNPLPDFEFVSEMEVVVERKKKPQQEPSLQKTPAIQKGITINLEKKKSTRGRKSVKEMSEGVALIEVPEDDILFQKMYYSIGKVADMFKVNQSLIRLWENEFDVLKPKKNGKGDRLFRPEDIKNIQLIYHLMRERKYTMEGAKDFIKNNKKATEKFSTIQSLKKLKGFLLELKANL